MTSLSNSRLENHKEHSNWSTKNGDIVDKARRGVSKGVRLWHLSNYRGAGLLQKEDKIFSVYSSKGPFSKSQKNVSKLFVFHQVHFSFISEN